MYLPYNTNKFLLHPTSESLLPNYPNPDLVRWELHRVWVVDATLAKGKRHTVPHRRFYQDEDTWQALLIDSWDNRGDIWKYAHSMPFIAMEFPVLHGAASYFIKDLQIGTWEFDALSETKDLQYKRIIKREAGFHSPNNLSSMGTR